MKRFYFLLFIFATFSLTSCAPDPRREAEAYATRKQADVSAAAQAQAMEQSKAMNEESMRLVAEKNSLEVERLKEVNRFIATVMQTGMVAGMFTLFIAVISLGIGLSFVFIAGGVGTAKRQLMKPYHEQIRLDPVTRQFPLLITKVEEGKYALSNPNTNSVTMLYDRNPADRMMIQAMSATQHDGALAYQARLSHRPGEIATIQSPQLEVIEVNA